MHEFAQTRPGGWKSRHSLPASADSIRMVMAMEGLSQPERRDKAFLRRHWDEVKARLMPSRRAHDSDGDVFTEHRTGPEGGSPGRHNAHQEIYLAALDQPIADAIRRLAAHE